MIGRLFQCSEASQPITELACDVFFLANEFYPALKLLAWLTALCANHICSYTHPTSS